MRTGFDKVCCGNGSGDGVIYEVFDPPWWQLGRWFSWYFLHRNRARGTLQILVSGQPKVVKCQALDLHERGTVVFPSNPLHK